MCLCLCFEQGTVEGTERPAMKARGKKRFVYLSSVRETLLQVPDAPNIPHDTFPYPFTPSPPSAQPPSAPPPSPFGQSPPPHHLLHHHTCCTFLHVSHRF
ncbi:hypothetical protein BaRGS_00012115 [Batillaria attramentaria]|uniref:Uncharacterized protein n=1 Tax=Batillaria attramentaria TaxID=370345 RepID=A0ABD0LBR7_9CAEN